MGHTEPALIAPAQNVYFSRLLDDVGDGSGAINFNGNYSVTPAVAKIMAGTDELLNVHRIIGVIVDNGAISADGYGGLAALTNGISIGKYDTSDTLVHDILDGLTMKSHEDIAALCYDLQLVDFGSASAKLVVWRWTFAKDRMAPIVLNPGESIRVTLNDSFVGINSHRWLMQGTRIHD